MDAPPPVLRPKGMGAPLPTTVSTLKPCRQHFCFRYIITTLRTCRSELCKPFHLGAFLLQHPLRDLVAWWLEAEISISKPAVPGLCGWQECVSA